MKLHLRIISVFLAFLVILSSSGIAVSKHICNGELKDIAINTKAESCGHAAAATIQCPIHKDMVIPVEADTKACCEDTNNLIKEDADQLDNIIQPIPHFGIVLLYSFPYGNLISTHKNIEFQHFRDLRLPPLIHKDIPLEVQSFLL